MAKHKKTWQECEKKIKHGWKYGIKTAFVDTQGKRKVLVELTFMNDQLSRNFTVADTYQEAVVDLHETLSYQPSYKPRHKKEPIHG